MESYLEAGWLLLHTLGLNEASSDVDVARALSSDALPVATEDVVLYAVCALALTRSSVANDVWRTVRYAFLGADALELIHVALAELVGSPRARSSELRLPAAMVPHITRQLIVHSRRQADARMRGVKFGAFAALPHVDCGAHTAREHAAPAADSKSAECEGADVRPTSRSESASPSLLPSGSQSPSPSPSPSPLPLSAANIPPHLRPRYGYAFTLDVDGRSHLGEGAGLVFIWVDPSHPADANAVQLPAIAVETPRSRAASSGSGQAGGVSTPKLASSGAGSRRSSVGEAPAPKASPVGVSTAATTSARTDGRPLSSAGITVDTGSTAATTSLQQPVLGAGGARAHALPDKYVSNILRWGRAYGQQPLVLNGAQCLLAVQEAAVHPEFRRGGATPFGALPLLDVYLHFLHRGCWIQCVDIARLAVLWLAGAGTAYIDTDMDVGPQRLPRALWSPSEWRADGSGRLPSTPLLAAAQDVDGLIQNNFIAVTAPFHPFLTLLLQAITASAAEEGHVIHATGPALLTAVYHSFRNTAVAGSASLLHGSALHAAPTAVSQHAFLVPETDNVARATIAALPEPVAVQYEFALTISDWAGAARLGGAHGAREPPPGDAPTPSRLLCTPEPTTRRRSRVPTGLAFASPMASGSGGSSSSRSATPEAPEGWRVLNELALRDIMCICPPYTFYPRHWTEPASLPTSLPAAVSLTPAGGTQKREECMALRPSFWQPDLSCPSQEQVAALAAKAGRPPRPPAAGALMVPGKGKGSSGIMALMKRRGADPVTAQPRFGVHGWDCTWGSSSSAGSPANPVHGYPGALAGVGGSATTGYGSALAGYRGGHAYGSAMVGYYSAQTFGPPPLGSSGIAAAGYGSAMQFASESLGSSSVEVASFPGVAARLGEPPTSRMGAEGGDARASTTASAGAAAAPSLSVPAPARDPFGPSVTHSQIDTEATPDKHSAFALNVVSGDSYGVFALAQRAVARMSSAGVMPWA